MYVRVCVCVFVCLYQLFSHDADIMNRRYKHACKNAQTHARKVVKNPHAEP